MYRGKLKGDVVGYNIHALFKFLIGTLISVIIVIIALLLFVYYPGIKR